MVNSDYQYIKIRGNKNLIYRKIKGRFVKVGEERINGFSNFGLLG